MLQILDQRWRDHLSDMDYLRDGIHLRQVAQQDPLTAWQKEGYVMFEQLLDAVEHDFVRYITHVEAVVEPVNGADEDLERATYERQQVAPGGTELRRAQRPGPAPRRPDRGKPERREAGPQRAVLVRVGQEVQAVPWPTIGPRTRCATPPPPSRTSRRGWAAPRDYLEDRRGSRAPSSPSSSAAGRGPEPLGRPGPGPRR